MKLQQLGLVHLDEVRRLRHVSFGHPQEGEAVERLRGDLERGAYWGLEEDAVLAAAKLEPVDHWFGGQRVPCQHVGSVVVPPEHRGRGVASALMRAVARQGASEHLGLSLLFPSTTALYRAGGWEVAGSYVEYQLDARQSPPLGTPLRPLAGEADWTAIRACHAEMGRALSGVAARPEQRWAHVRRADFTYVLDAQDGAGIEAYLCYSPKPDEEAWQYTLDVADWGATTVRGFASLLGFVGRHGTFGKDVSLTGPIPHPWSFLVPEQDLRGALTMYWMARGLDLPACIAARGFAPGVGLSVTFAVDDPLIGEARGPWRLEVADSRGHLYPFPGADVTLDVRAVGPLFTGFTSPTQLALAGLVRGPADALAMLGTAFAGPAPILLDYF